MRKIAKKTTARRAQKPRSNVAEILSASYRRFTSDKETLMALKAVLRSAAKARV
jgi:hypothetical protein